MTSGPAWDDATATDGTVLSLQILHRHGDRPRPVTEVRAMPGHGLEGDLHGKSRPGSRRQVLLVDRGTLAAMGLREGDLREQITVAFAALESLAPGTLLQVGDATLELTGACEPCTHIGGLNGVADPEAFRQALDGRRGQTARVVAVEGAGRIRVGDRIAVRAPIPR
jgi:MOSC domain-containing protein YiiM